MNEDFINELIKELNKHDVHFCSIGFNSNNTDFIKDIPALIKLSPRINCSVILNKLDDDNISPDITTCIETSKLVMDI